MPSEIERKFLVTGTSWQAATAGLTLRQGYLSSTPERVVRVRVAGQSAALTDKGITLGISRLEFEYSIPVADATLMLDAPCEKPLIEMTRYRRTMANMAWEIDVFHGANEGLVIAEIELQNEDQAFERPQWLGDEVSNDPRHFNSNLVAHPFLTWHRHG